jgi:hypothetical protein
MRGIAIIVLVTVIGFSMAACPADGGNSGSPARVIRKIFRSVVSGSLNIYELVIDSESPASGNTYTLSLYNNGGTLLGKSTGTMYPSN